MPTQTIAATLRSESVMTVNRIESPRLLSADGASRSVLTAWLNASPLPGAVMTSTGELTVAYLGVGSSQAMDGAIGVDAALRVSPDPEIAPTTAEVVVGGAVHFIAGSDELGALSAVVVVGGSMHLATPVALLPR